MYLLVTCQALLVAVFATSGFGKLRSRAEWSAFVQSLRDMRIVPARLTRPAAVGTVVTELAAVALLAVPATALLGLAVATGLLGVFVVAIVITARRDAGAVCRCFGRASTAPLGMRHVIRNLSLIALAGLGAVAAVGSGEGLVPSWTGAHPAGLAIAAAAGLILAALVIFFDDIVDLFTDPVTTTGQTEQRSTSWRT